MQELKDVQRSIKQLIKDTLSGARSCLLSETLLRESLILGDGQPVQEGVCGRFDHAVKRLPTERGGRIRATVAWAGAAAPAHRASVCLALSVPSGMAQ